MMMMVRVMVDVKEKRVERETTKLALVRIIRRERRTRTGDEGGVVSC